MCVYHYHEQPKYDDKASLLMLGHVGVPDLGLYLLYPESLEQLTHVRQVFEALVLYAEDGHSYALER